MSLLVRVDSKEITSRLESSLIVGNNYAMRKMKSLSSLILDSSKNKILSKLDYYPTIFLYGPPNTGKTTLVYSLFDLLKSKNNNINLYYLNFSLAMSAEYGGTSKNLIEVFSDLTQECSNENPKILLIDEIDQFCITRDKSNEHDASRRAMSAFLLELDKLHPSLVQGIIIVAISNIEDKIDVAVVRRFNLKIKVYERLSISEFKEYLIKLVAIISSLKLSDEDIKKLYNIYLDKNMTIPDVKGCFRNVITNTLNEKDITINEIIVAFNEAYSSVENILE
ncbi:MULTISPECIES: ATP-binding protein [unclassified Acinetobacter]|uniref:ATP-binding protein n=2 Tax=Acinetobacter TaxID=469 RepID=UPI0015D2A27E|nr:MULTISPECIES: ATP-binding protein [unclassified Acinetobacter]